MSEEQGSLRLLVVDDSPEDYEKFVRLLRTGDSFKAEVGHAETGYEVLDLCCDRPPDCILLDYRLSEMDGFEFITRVKEVAGEPQVPIVMFTGMGSEYLAVEAMKNGAHDYLNKNTMTYGQVSRAILGAIELVGLKRELEATKERLEQLAFYDPLTGIGNRNLFADHLDHGLLLARRGASPLAVLVIDLDQFKTVNDTFGHAAGDAVLRAVGGRLSDVLRQSDTATRLGGDEFAVILETDVTTDGATIVAGKIIDALTQPIEHDGGYLRIGASIGIALFPEHADDGDQLVHCADVAMYKAKRLGGGFSVFATSAGTERPMVNSAAI